MKTIRLFSSKFLVFLVTLSLAVSMAACAPATPSATPPRTPAATQVPPASEPVSPPGVIQVPTPLPSLTAPAEPAPVATPPVVVSPGVTSPRATVGPGQSVTPIPVTGTPQTTGVAGAPALVPLIPATVTGPAISIVYPEDFYTFHTSVIDRNVLVEVMTANFKLVDKIGQANAAGEGHIVYYLNVNPPTTAGTSALTAPGTYFITTATSMMWQNVPNGAHKISAQLVNNDNTVLSPAAWAQIQTYLQYNIGDPSIQIIAPKMGASTVSGSVKIETQVLNFFLINKIGEPALPGQGHIIYYMDVDPPIVQGQVATTANGAYSVTAEPSYTWPNVSPGVHTFSVQLVNNDNTPLGPPANLPAVSQVTVTVK